MTVLDRLAKVQELGALPPLEYDLKRKQAAKEMGVRVGVLDDEVKKFRGTKGGQSHSNIRTSKRFPQRRQAVPKVRTLVRMRMEASNNCLRWLNHWLRWKIPWSRSGKLETTRAARAAVWTGNDTVG
jgi:hypothetical protein